MNDSGRKGWHDRRGAERMFWCDRCGVPLLGAMCGLCGAEGRYVPLSPPGDIRPAMRQGRALLRSMIARDLGLPSSSPMLSGIVLFNRISGYDRADQVYIDGQKVGTLSFDPVSREYSFAPDAAGASMLIAAGARRLEFSGDVGRGHIKGKSLPLSAFRAVGDAPPPGKDVLVAGNGIAAAGRMQDGSIRIRDIGPDDIRFSGLKSTLDDAVEASAGYLGRLEERALSEIGSVLIKRQKLPLTVSFSGGKDSLVALELARRVRSCPDIIFSNTGLEFPETVQHIRSVAKERGSRLLEKAAGEAFWENLSRFGLPAKDFRWCCKVCKLAPMTELLMENYPKGVLTVEGRRRRESFARQGIRLVEESPFVPGQVNIEPIREWTALEVWLYIRWRRLRHNPLYDEDLERIGCWLCPATLESELEGLARTHPGLHQKWMQTLREEGHKQGLEDRAISVGAWRWKSLPPKMKELMAAAGIPLPVRPAQAQASLNVARGISPCETGGYTVDAMLRLPANISLSRAANMLHMLGDARFSEDMGVAVIRKGTMSAKLFESGQIVITGPRPQDVSAFMRDIVGLVMRASMCTKCGICARSCPKNALTVGEAPVLDTTRCSRCMKCGKACVLVHYADRMVEGMGKGNDGQSAVGSRQ
jgi:phosphoadenosine phosphosulfate reductase